MSSILVTLLVAASSIAQHPTSASPAAPALSAEEVARLEASHLTNVRQVTSGFSRAGEGYFSPDGRSIIFQAVPYLAPSIFHHPRPDEDGYQIYTGVLDQDSPARMVSTGKGRCTCPFFHPSGNSILFASTHLSPSTEAAPSKGPAYSRTERYRWEFPETMDIFSASPDGGNLKRLTDTPGYDAEGSYSADGSRIVFTSFRDGDAEIYIMDADGKNPRRITHAKGYDGGPFFSPDGKRIIYRSDRKGNDLLQVYVNNTEGTAERALTQNEFVNWGPYWHPDGRHMIYATRSRRPRPGGSTPRHQETARARIPDAAPARERRRCSSGNRPGARSPAGCTSRRDARTRCGYRRARAVTSRAVRYPRNRRCRSRRVRVPQRTSHPAAVPSRPWPG